MINYTVENLYHFQCSLCSHWFSIGDWREKENLSCPNCNVSQSVRFVGEDMQGAVKK